jgi:hypothetical protein
MLAIVFAMNLGDNIIAGSGLSVPTEVGLITVAGYSLSTKVFG